MPGSGPRQAEYVMIGAHYDHLDSRSDGAGNCFANGAVGGEICNGAADNASGVAATLAIAKAIKKLRPATPLGDPRILGLRGGPAWTDRNYYAPRTRWSRTPR